MTEHDATETAYKNGYKAGYDKGYFDGENRKQGVWEPFYKYVVRYRSKRKKLAGFTCSLCKRRIFWDDLSGPMQALLREYPYCHCGAKMKVKEIENEQSSND